VGRLTGTKSLDAGHRTCKLGSKATSGKATVGTMAASRGTRANSKTAVYRFGYLLDTDTLQPSRWEPIANRRWR